MDESTREKSKTIRISSRTITIEGIISIPGPKPANPLKIPPMPGSRVISPGRIIDSGKIYTRPREYQIRPEPAEQCSYRTLEQAADYKNYLN